MLVALFIGLIVLIPTFLSFFMPEAPDAKFFRYKNKSSLLLSFPNTEKPLEQILVLDAQGNPLRNTNAG